jgi:carbon-monoxide dehydrogenase large subunit/6-hydroxypseudooxynicotine dehydrogenase subunit gamma
MSYVGRSVRRLEDPPLLTGDAVFVADLALPDMVAMRVVRSPIAHGRLTSVDTAEAANAPGVIAVLTARDLDLPPIGMRMTDIGGLDPYRQPVLADGRVRYVGEPIAVVIAENAYLAEDAAELVWPEIEDLDPHLDPTRAGEFEDGLTSEVALVEKGYGDVDEALAASPN